CAREVPLIALGQNRFDVW
nr:immunoglobulin heavy chain junction region [Macaca mulatta]